MTEKKTYSEKLKDPRWQKKRLKILERDEFTCQECADSESTLHVHHRYYIRGAEPWEYPDEALQTLCEHCHQSEREYRAGAEEELLHAMRRNFSYGETIDLAVSLLNGVEKTPQHLPEVILGALCYTLTHPELQKGMIDRYFEALKAKREAYEAREKGGGK